MKRLALAGMFAILAAAAFAQQLPPWSEQLPQPQRPAPGQYPQGPPQYQGQPGPLSGPGPNAGLTDDQGDAPDRGVARISTMVGNVSVRRGDSGDLVAAAVNAPLVAGDRIVTSDTGRAEVQFDFANLIRLGPATEVRLSELAYHRYQIQIATGTTIFRVVRDTDAQVEISTPSVAVRPVKAGVYRVSVLPDGTSQITVRLGDAEIFSPRGSEPLHPGQTMVARGLASDPEFQLSAAVADDDFERWCISRDRTLERSPSARHMSPDVAGSEDLDGNGRWVNDGQYGNVWAPAVAADPGWAPYSCGRWVWLDFYGWSWVGCESWGWAPYHYGRWYRASFGWAWWPGPAYGPYYWRPALVGFFGWGGPGFGVGFGFGFGNVGWVALAPFERFSPWYGPGIYGHGFGAVNIARNVNVSNIYRNARVSNGVTSMASNQFGRAGVNGATNIRAGAGDLARAGAVRGAMPIAPSRESTHFSNTAASTSVHSSENSHFYSSRSTSSAATSSSANHVSFDQQRQAMSRSASGTGSAATTHSAASPAAHSTGATGSSSSSNSGWQRVNPTSSSSGSTSAVSRRPTLGSPGSTAGSTSAGSTSQSSAGGWQRFNGNNSGVSSGSATAGNGNVSSGSRSQGVRINPSVVQSRGGSTGGSSSSSSGGGSRSGGSSRGGGGGRR